MLLVLAARCDHFARDDVQINYGYFCSAAVEQLRGDALKVWRVLGWIPKFALRELTIIMVAHGPEQTRHERALFDTGHAMPEASGHDQ